MASGLFVRYPTHSELEAIENKMELEELRQEIEKLKRQMVGLRLTVSRLTKKGRKKDE